MDWGSVGWGGGVHRSHPLVIKNDCCGLKAFSLFCVLVPFAWPYVVCLCSGVGVQMKEIVCFQCFVLFLIFFILFIYCQSLVLGSEGAKCELPPPPLYLCMYTLWGGLHQLMHANVAFQHSYVLSVYNPWSSFPSIFFNFIFKFLTYRVINTMLLWCPSVCFWMLCIVTESGMQSFG